MALADQWRAIMGSGPPAALPTRLLRLALAWEEQAGGEKTAATRRARRLERAASGLGRGNAPAPGRRHAAPGTSLIRDWQGRTYRVEVIVEGRFRFDGRD